MWVPSAGDGSPGVVESRDEDTSELRHHNTLSEGIFMLRPHP